MRGLPLFWEKIWGVYLNHFLYIYIYILD